jgi:hypothetical protein
MPAENSQKVEEARAEKSSRAPDRASRRREVTRVIMRLWLNVALLGVSAALVIRGVLWDLTHIGKEWTGPPYAGPAIFGFLILFRILWPIIESEARAQKLARDARRFMEAECILAVKGELKEAEDAVRAHQLNPQTCVSNPSEGTTYVRVRVPKWQMEIISSWFNEAPPSPADSEIPVGTLLWYHARESKPNRREEQ